MSGSFLDQPSRHIRNWTAAFLVVTTIVLVSCQHKIPVDPGQQQIEATFSSIQANIFTPKCVNAGCHPGGAAPMSLRSDVAYNNLVNKASIYGPLRVAPGDPENSMLYIKVKGDSKYGSRMPVGGQMLSTEEISAIRDWIQKGAPND